MPESFGDFSNCRIIIDCTEVTIETPRKDLNAAKLSYSNYKHNLTAKFLSGVAPNGAITFMSGGYPGSTSDKELTDDSKFLTKLQVPKKPRYFSFSINIFDFNSGICVGYMTSITKGNFFCTFSNSPMAKLLCNVKDMNIYIS